MRCQLAGYGDRDNQDIQILALSAFREVAGEEIEEGLHLGVECPLGSGILDGGDETGDLIAHGLGGDAGGGGLEVDVGRATDAGVEGVAAGHKRGRHAGQRRDGESSRERGI